MRQRQQHACSSQQAAIFQFASHAVEHSHQIAAMQRRRRCGTRPQQLYGCMLTPTTNYSCKPAAAQLWVHVDLHQETCAL
jgi:hypothetical protein